MTSVTERTHPAADPTFDPFAPEFLDDPYPTFAQLRAEQPVFYAPQINYWLLSRYDDVRRALRDNTSFSASNALSPVTPICPRAQATLRDGGFRSLPILTNADPPIHTRTRRIANLAFTPRRVAQMEGFVRDLVVRFIDERLRDGRVDIVHALTWELPALVLFKVLGVPDEDVPQVKVGAEKRLLFMFGRGNDDQQVEVAEGMVGFWRYVEDLAASRLAQPRDDFTSDLVHVPDADGIPLTQQEAATVLFGLLLAGHETTTNLLSHGFHRFLDVRSRWEELGSEPELIPNAIEELLRFDSSVIMWRRATKLPVRLSDVEVPAGANLLLLIGAANRDPSVFDDPDVFDIRRPNAREHLSFGGGNHLCLGAPLARLEARVVFEEFTQRLPNLRLVPGQRLAFPEYIAFRGPRSLLVEWDAVTV